MSRVNQNLLETERRKKLREWLRSNHVSSINDIRSLFKEAVAAYVDSGLEEELYESAFKRRQTAARSGDAEGMRPAAGRGELSRYTEEKILAMYARGMTAGDIQNYIRNVHDIRISQSELETITDKMLPMIRDWQQRPLEKVYAVVFFDVLPFFVRKETHVVKKAACFAVGIDLNGRKNLLGIWIDECVNRAYWENLLSDLRGRGTEDILIVSSGEQAGFSAACKAVFPQAENYGEIVRQIRDSTKRFSYTDLLDASSDLKLIYMAVDEAAAQEALHSFAERWGKKYPEILSQWQKNWLKYSAYFRLPAGVRQLLYSFHTIEELNRKISKSAKGRPAFLSDDSLLKLLYLTSMDVTKVWTRRLRDWSITHMQLSRYFTDRISAQLSES